MAKKSTGGKSPRFTPSVGPKPTKPRKERVLAEIRKIQRTTNNLIPRAPFGRLVREVSQDFKTDLRFEALAIDVLRDASESYLTDIFCDAVRVQCHCHNCKRQTLYPRDIQLARILRGEKA